MAKERDIFIEAKKFGKRKSVAKIRFGDVFGWMIQEDNKKKKGGKSGK